MAADDSRGHRFEATQALRQVLNRAVAWELINYNPAKRGVPLRVNMWIAPAATGLRPSELQDRCSRRCPVGDQERQSRQGRRRRAARRPQRAPPTV